MTSPADEKTPSPWGDLCITPLSSRGTPSPVEGEGTFSFPLGFRKGLLGEWAGVRGNFSVAAIKRNIQSQGQHANRRAQSLPRT